VTAELMYLIGIIMMLIYPLRENELSSTEYVQVGWGVAASFLLAVILQLSRMLINPKGM